MREWLCLMRVRVYLFLLILFELWSMMLVLWILRVVVCLVIDGVNLLLM